MTVPELIAACREVQPGGPFWAVELCRNAAVELERLSGEEAAKKADLIRRLEAIIEPDGAPNWRGTTATIAEAIERIRRGT